MDEEPRKRGQTKGKTARIANVHAVGTLDHDGTWLKDRTKAELFARAKAIGIEGRSGMSKDELATAIRRG